MQPSPPDFNPGDQFRASWLNSLIRFVRTCRVIPDNSTVLGTETPAGLELTVNLPQEADFRIDSGTNPYSATEMKAVPGGTWTVMTGGRVVSASDDGLYERNASKTVVALTIVHARRDISSGAWIFDKTACNTTTTAPAATKANKTSPALNPFAQPPSPDTLAAFDDFVFTPNLRTTVARLTPLRGQVPTDEGPVGSSGGGLQPSGGPS